MPPTPHLETESPAPTAVPQLLGLWDAISIIVGIVVGTAIFKSTTFVFANVTAPWQAYAAWLLGGILSLCGAFCYAELATTFPRNGGDYEYLTRAYGRWVGFLFGWAQLTVILSGSIAAMGYAFGDYALQVWALPQGASVWLAATAVVLLSLVNLFGVAVGKSTQNLLSATKVLGLIGVAVAGFLGSGPESTEAVEASAGGAEPAFGLAMVFVLYAYGGWNDAAFVAAEVREPNRNLPRALLAGIAGITIIYLIVNASYLSVLGLDAARQTATPAADLLQQAVGSWGAKAISVLVMVSALGAINGMILTGSRIYATMGTDHPLFAWLGAWNRRLGVPVTSLIAQGAFSILLILAVGTQAGRGLIDGLLTTFRVNGLPWDQYYGGFETLVAGTAPVFWCFFLMTGVSLFLLRWQEPDRLRPFSVPLYPLPVLVFCLTCGYMLYSSLSYAKWLALLGVVPPAVGLPLYFLSQMRRAPGR